MALFWILVVVAIVLAVRALGDRARYAGPPGSPPAGPAGAPRETPLEILQRRYARGEIDKREFEEKKKDLS
ncbi:MAG TPA: SHOCT domain-containing protein [Anaeromyxobacter sp.]